MKNIKTYFVLSAFLCLTGIATAHGDGTLYTGHVSALDDNSRTELYRYERVVTRSDTTTRNLHTTFTPTGEVAVIQEALLQNKGAPTLESFAMDQRQLGILASLKIERDNDTQRVIYHLQHDGKTRSKTATFKSDEILTVGPTLYDTIWQHWDALTAGKTVAIRFLVVERQMDVGFDLSASTADDDVKVRMRPSPFFMRWFVDDVNFVFDRATRRVKSMEGRVPPMRKNGDRWVELDARVTYDYR